MLFHGCQCAAKGAAEGFIIITLILLSPFSKLTLCNNSFNLFSCCRTHFRQDCMYDCSALAFMYGDAPVFRVVYSGIIALFCLWAAAGCLFIFALCGSLLSCVCQCVLLVQCLPFVSVWCYNNNNILIKYIIYSLNEEPSARPLSAIDSCLLLRAKMQPGLLIKQKGWEERGLVYWVAITMAVSPSWCESLIGVIIKGRQTGEDKVLICIKDKCW